MIKTFCYIGFFILCSVSIVNATVQEVYDNQLVYNESIHHNEILRQWALHNSQQAQLLSLQQEQMQNENLAQHFDNKDHWNEVKELQQSSLGMLEAQLICLEEFKSLNEYLAATLTRRTYYNCLKRTDCRFENIKADLQTDQLKHLRDSAQLLTQEQQQLQKMQTQLSRLINESHNSNNLSNLLDALLKINAHSAIQLDTLNRQINLLLNLRVSESSSQSLLTHAEHDEETRFANEELLPNAEHFDLRIASHVKN